jgi:hypothetical protein
MCEIIYQTWAVLGRYGALVARNESLLLMCIFIKSVLMLAYLWVASLCGLLPLERARCVVTFAFSRLFIPDFKNHNVAQTSHMVNT